MAAAPSEKLATSHDMDKENAAAAASIATMQQQHGAEDSTPGENLTFAATRQDTDLAAVEKSVSVPIVPHYLEGLQLFLVVGAMTVASFLVLLDTSIIATAIPAITSDFHSLPDIGWYGAAYQISSAAIQPLVGKLYTQFSLKWTFVVYFAIFEIGSLMCGVAPSSNVLIIGRAVAGIGVAGVFAGALTIISASVGPKNRAISTGIMIGCAQMGIVIGPLVGGAFTTHVTWRWCFYINLPLGAIVLAGICFIRIQNQQPVPPFSDAIRNIHRRLDFGGFAIFGGAAIMLLLALQWGGNEYRWDSSVIIGLFCGSGAALIAFIGWAWKRGDEAILPPRLLKLRIVIACSFLTMFMMASTFIASYWLPVYFQTVRGESAITSGVHLLPNILMSAFFGVLGGFLISKVGYYLPQSVVGAAIITIANGLISTLGPTSSTGKWAGYQILLGAGRGMIQQVSFTAIPASCPPKMIPIGMSLIVFGQYLGGSIFLSVSNVVFSTSLKSSLREYAPMANATAIIQAGASADAVRSVVPADQLADVLKAYAKSINDVFLLATGAAGLLFITCFFIGWVDVRPPKEGEAKKSKEEEAGPTGAEGSMLDGSETEANEEPSRV